MNKNPNEIRETYIPENIAIRVVERMNARSEFEAAYFHKAAARMFADHLGLTFEQSDIDESVETVRVTGDGFAFARAAQFCRDEYSNIAKFGGEYEVSESGREVRTREALDFDKARAIFWKEWTANC
jgi:hypothetical protein